MDIVMVTIADRNYFHCTYQPYHLFPKNSTQRNNQLFR